MIILQLVNFVSFLFNFMIAVIHLWTHVILNGLIEVCSLMQYVQGYFQILFNAHLSVSIEVWSVICLVVMSEE